MPCWGADEGATCWVNQTEVMSVMVSLVRFKSKLSDNAVQATFEERADRYRTVPGLVEKIYLRFRESGEFGAVYVWDSEKALMDFRETELARTIPDAYQVEEAPLVELADVCLVIQPDIALRGAPDEDLLLVHSEILEFGISLTITQDDLGLNRHKRWVRQEGLLRRRPPRATWLLL